MVGEAGGESGGMPRPCNVRGCRAVSLRARGAKNNLAGRTVADKPEAAAAVVVVVLLGVAAQRKVVVAWVSA